MRRGMSEKRIVKAPVRPAMEVVASSLTSKTAR
jgi:hypothetical protein